LAEVSIHELHSRFLQIFDCFPFAPLAISRLDGDSSYQKYFDGQFEKVLHRSDVSRQRCPNQGVPERRPRRLQRHSTSCQYGYHNGFVPKKWFHWLLSYCPGARPPSIALAILDEALMGDPLERAPAPG
jgi:hypothetical protein